VLDRVLAICDVWMPDYAEDVFGRLYELRGRSSQSKRVYTMSTPNDPAALERCASAGVEGVIYRLPSAGRGPIEQALERYEQAVASFRRE
jgi:hypothetical protein